MSSKTNRINVRTAIELGKDIIAKFVKVLEKWICKCNFWASEPVTWFFIISYGKNMFSSQTFLVFKCEFGRNWVQQLRYHCSMLSVYLSTCLWTFGLLPVWSWTCASLCEHEVSLLVEVLDHLVEVLDIHLTSLVPFSILNSCVWEISVSSYCPQHLVWSVCLC